jgi:hypothetical protein
MKEYKNRYGDVFTFTRDENHDILWEGNFDYCRIGYPNDYTKAYDEYISDNNLNKDVLSFNQFKEEVHKYDDETHQYIYDKYVRLVESLKDEIDMVDPSGGCYISRGMSLDFLGFKGYKVKDFKKSEGGLKIITEKCDKCHLAGGIHKMGCETRKVTILLDDEKYTYDKDEVESRRKFLDDKESKLVPNHIIEIMKSDEELGLYDESK